MSGEFIFTFILERLDQIHENMDEIFERMERLRAKLGNLVINDDLTEKKEEIPQIQKNPEIESTQPKDEKHITFNTQQRHIKYKKIHRGHNDQSQELDPNKSPETQKKNAKKDDFNIEELSHLHQKMQTHLISLNKILAKNKTARKIERMMKEKETKAQNTETKMKIQSTQQIERIKEKKMKQETPQSSSIDSENTYSSSQTDEMDSQISNHETLSDDSSESSSSAGNYTAKKERLLNDPDVKELLQQKKELSPKESSSDTDLKIMDLMSVKSLLKEAKMERKAYKELKEDNDFIPGETIFMSSDNDSNLSLFDDSSDVPMVPIPIEKMLDDPNDDIFLSNSSNDDERYDRKENQKAINNNNTALSPNQLMDSTIDFYESPITKTIKTLSFTDNSNGAILANFDLDNDQASDEDSN